MNTPVAVGGELRCDERDQNWVIIAPGRAARPHDAESEGSGCPLCPGPTQDTPPERWRLRATEQPGWRVRAVPNRYPVLRAASPGPAWRPYEPHCGRGEHELLIESPRHDWDMATAESAELVDVLTAWQQRHRALRTGSAYVTVFRNHGVAAGTSLEHPHSQLVATPVVPPVIQRAYQLATTHYRHHQRCLESDLANAERRSGRRVVLVRQAGTAFVPFAPPVDYGVRIVPLVSRADFGAVPPGELAGIAELLRCGLGALSRMLGDPAYNLVVRTAPAGKESSPALCWSIDVLPRLAVAAGLELGTGLPVVSRSPEAMAADLRRAAAEARTEPGHRTG